MFKDMALGMARHALTVAAGALVAKGVVDAGTAEAVVGGLLALVGFGWSALEKHGRAV